MGLLFTSLGKESNLNSFYLSFNYFTNIDEKVAELLSFALCQNSNLNCLYLLFPDCNLNEKGVELFSAALK